MSHEDRCKAKGRKRERGSRSLHRRGIAIVLLAGSWILGLHALAPLQRSVVRGQDRPIARPIRTFFETRSLTHERLLPYLREARPDLVQIGNYGAMFHGYADHPRSVGWPMNLPVAGERAALAFQRDLNAQVHDLGLKVVGHFRLVKVMGDWANQQGFVEYYNQRWPVDLLGPKPHPKLEELLQCNADGEPIQTGRYDQAQLALCLSSPPAREMLKRMLKVAIDDGVDGVITEYNYRFDCACPHCQAAFKRWLGEHFTPQQIHERLNIENLSQHHFATLPAAIPGYPDPDEAGELEWLAKRWGAEQFKQMFDEIFLDYGRSLKPDLLVAQWNHLGHVGVQEERAFLPVALWGRGEDYFWYSGGAAFVDNNLDLAKGKAGDAWLSCLYIRELGGGKPFVMGKYDRVRTAASLAEGFATGGIGMGRYQRFEEPAGYETLVQYNQFVHRRRDLYDHARPWADAALVLPRQSVWNRRPASLTAFRELGQALVQRQCLLDVLADEHISAERLSSYPAVILPEATALSAGQLAALKQYVADGGVVLARGAIGELDENGNRRAAAGLPGAVAIDGPSIEEAADAVEARLQAAGGSHIEAPWTVRAAGYQQTMADGQRFLLHLVNYDRQDGAPENNRTGPETELPRPVGQIVVKLRLPPGVRVRSVSLDAPGQTERMSLKFREAAGRVQFTVPQMLVYAVAAIETEAADEARD